MFKFVKKKIAEQFIKDTYLDLNSNSNRTDQILALAYLLEREVATVRILHGESLEAQLRQAGSWDEVSGPCVVSSTILSVHADVLRVTAEEISENMSMSSILPSDQEIVPFYALAELAYDRGLRIEGRASRVRSLTASIGDGDLRLVHV